MTIKNRYFPFVSENVADSNKGTILFCFHHAGGTATTYRPWTLKANDSVIIMCVELPGKGTRRTERIRAILTNHAYAGASVHNKRSRINGKQVNVSVVTVEKAFNSEAEKKINTIVEAVYSR